MSDPHFSLDEIFPPSDKTAYDEVNLAERENTLSTIKANLSLIKNDKVPDMGYKKYVDEHLEGNDNIINRIRYKQDYWDLLKIFDLTDKWFEKNNDKLNDIFGEKGLPKLENVNNLKKLKYTLLLGYVAGIELFSEYIDENDSRFKKRIRVYEKFSKKIENIIYRKIIE